MKFLGWCNENFTLLKIIKSMVLQTGYSVGNGINITSVGYRLLKEAFGLRLSWILEPP